MKIVYIGTSDGLAETLAERMGQEGNDVYLLSDKALPQKSKNISRYRFYRSPRKGESFGKLLRSISPDCVIFAGNHYISSAHEEESDEDVTLLTRSLRAIAAFPQVRFILLSSIEVYGNTREKADESAECAAVSERGIRFIREEQLLDIYRKQHGINTVILRASWLYTDRPREDMDDFLSQIFSAAARAEDHMTACIFQPLHVSDFVDAIKRVADGGTQDIYNVCGSSEISAERLYQLACWQQDLQEPVVCWEDSGCITLADSSRIRQELEWRDFRNLEEQLKKGEISYTRVKTKRQNKKKWSIPTDVRQMAENLILFEVFLLLHSLCASNSVFSHVNWLMIYVILISVSYNLNYSRNNSINR